MSDSSTSCSCSWSEEWIFAVAIAVCNVHTAKLLLKQVNDVFIVSSLKDVFNKILSGKVSDADMALKSLLPTYHHTGKMNPCAVLLLMTVKYWITTWIHLYNLSDKYSCHFDVLWSLGFHKFADEISNFVNLTWMCCNPLKPVILVLLIYYYSI